MAKGKVVYVFFLWFSHVQRRVPFISVDSHGVEAGGWSFGAIDTHAMENGSDPLSIRRSIENISVVLKVVEWREVKQSNESREISTSSRAWKKHQGM